MQNFSSHQTQILFTAIMYPNIVIQRRKSVQPDVTTQYACFMAAETLCIQRLPILVLDPSKLL